MTTRSGPPRAALWLIERALSSPAAEAIGGDLIEGYTHVAAARGHRAARRWFWRQTLLSLAIRGRAGVRPVTRREPTHRKAGLMSGWMQDLRLALRVLVKSPGFAVTAVATLAIGIAGATTIVTAAGWAWLRPLPYAEPGRLVHVGEAGSDGTTVGNVGFETVLDWQARAKAFAAVVPIRAWTATLSGDTGAIRVPGLRVGWQYFRTLGIQPALGRDFTADDDRADRWRVVLMSHRLWQQRFGGDPGIVGRSITLGERDYEVLGVLPADFEPLVSEFFYERADLWAPLGYEPGQSSACRTCRHLRAIGRLDAAATTASATAELAGIHASLRTAYPDDYQAAAPGIEPLGEQVTGQFRRPLQILMGAVGFLLFIACANVASLLITRSVDRRQEMGIRAALGAGRGRLARQLFAESLVVAAAATALGLGLAKIGLVLLAGGAPDEMYRLDRATSDPAIWIVASGIGTLALAAFGLLPAFAAARTDLQTALRGVRHSASPRVAGLREVMTVGQVAVALVLVISGGLMYRTVDRLLSVDPGFNPDGVLTAQFSLVGARWAEDEAVYAFQREIVDRVRALPGVESVGLTGLLPLGGSYDRRGFGIDGQTYATPDDEPRAERYSVTPGYFDAMQVPLRRGRLIDARDSAASAPVTLVNETAMRTYWNGADPVGDRVRFGDDDGTPWVTVVGVVADVRHYDLETPPIPQVYLPQSQSTDSYLTMVVRAPERMEGLGAQIRNEVAALASDVPVDAIVPFTALQTAAVGTRLFMMHLLGLFAGAAVLLATVGLYGVISQTVLGREREIGIRVSLGASRTEVAGLILRRGVLLIAAGLVAGAGIAAAASGVLEAQLLQTAAIDPVTYGAAAAGLLLAGLAAHVLPLRRAMRIDPNLILRGD